ncbi:MAG: TIGR02281 family clan AA aspartic protease [Pseudomonadota bacterium]
MTEPRKTGFSMYVLAAALLIALLTALFSGILDHQVNPNKKPEWVVNEDGKRRITLQRNREGHYVANGSINGEQVIFLLDTGATMVAVPQELARRLALTPGQEISTVTANGITNAYVTNINEITLGGIIQYDVPAALVPNLPGGQILLGMSFLKRLDFSQRGDTLVLEPPLDQGR